MIVTEIEVENGFRKADIHNIPAVSSDIIFNFAAACGTGAVPPSTDNDNALIIDYVQIRRTAEACEVNALVFPGADFANTEAHANVTIKISENLKQIVECSCSLCIEQITCPHILAFVFWLHRKSTARTASSAICDFWGHELESLMNEQNSTAHRIRDLFPANEARTAADLDIAAISNEEGQAFLDAVLEDIDSSTTRNSALYRQCVETIDDFESIFVHNTMLNSPGNGVVDPCTFVQHMELQAARGLFENLNDVTKNTYKSPLWLEAQYMRLRCSLMHRIAARKSPDEDEEIFNMLFCKNRDRNMEERQQLKQQKRFILKQTEKLEKKPYFECGLLLNENYPYIVAAPDGITDDHIVEIKSPKTEEDFEKYLEARETIAPKYMAQIQIQMVIANVKKALYCVLSPTFDTNGALHYVWVKIDNEFLAGILSMAEDFWKEVVYPRLEKIYERN